MVGGQKDQTNKP